ncbi:MAG TPA: RagB/SusD family nutrient uptake outer membrane protein, partial [Sphingobacterium sp.]|nr:RagB/SusD family nutrient uptake outer membrane protein [Sphingobacterium sp.]
MKKVLYFILTCSMIGCSQDFLDVKPSSNTVVPTTLDDFQQLMDYGNLVFAFPDMMEVLADDYYLEETYWAARPTTIRNAHVWAVDIFETIEADFTNWERSYNQIFYANVVLEGVEKITKDHKNERQHNQVRGTAYFLRAWALYNLAQLYAPAYSAATASQDLGVPIPLRSDVNEKVKRNSVEEVYSRILGDLETADALLQHDVDFSRPSKAAANALCARVLLAMGNYVQALHKAEGSLREYGVLADLNTETLDYKQTVYLAFDPNGPFIYLSNQNIQIVDELYNSYENNDLRLRYFTLNNLRKPRRIASHALA